MQCAMIGLMANGYRPSTTMPDHHQTMIQSLPLTFGMQHKSWVLLDALRRKRNASDYSGDPVEPAATATCIGQAEELLRLARRWLEASRPELLQ
jgi:hypothetical protein